MPNAKAGTIPALFLRALSGENFDSTPIFPTTQGKPVFVPPNANVGMKVNTTFHTVLSSSRNFVVDAHTSRVGIHLDAAMM